MEVSDVAAVDEIGGADDTVAFGFKAAPKQVYAGKSERMSFIVSRRVTVV